MMGPLTDDGMPIDDEDDVEDGNGEWERRFRVASVACCTAVILLIVNGLISGILIRTEPQRPPFAMHVPLPGLPHHFALYQKALVLLSGFGQLSAALLLLAVLLGVMGRVDDDEDPRALALASVLGVAVVAGSVALWAVEIWHVATNVPGVRAPVAGLAGPLATATIAAAATWWARGERSRA